MTLLILVVVAALAFDFINGFHDTANAIATVVSTRVLTPRVAILMASVLNLVGAIVASEVAKTISKDLVDPHVATTTLTLSAIIGGIVWNLLTWFYGIPSSSSHALIGGLVGAAVAHAGLHGVLWGGLLNKVVLPLLISPLVGFGVGYVLMTLISLFFANSRPRTVGSLFRRLQIASAAAMSFAHGNNDAQKSMGIITLALISAGYLGKDAGIPLWVKLSCAVVMALGTSVGGWRIIKTMGHKIIRLEPVNGFAAETAGAATILVAGHFGAPVSTTHVIASSIFGVGASKRLSAVKWEVALNMVIAWVLTIPASALVGAGIYTLLSLFGL